MRRRLLPLLVATLLLGSCGETQPLPDVDLLVRVEAGATTVRPGQGIPLKVTRVWRADHEPSPWDDASLEPLILRDEVVTHREGNGRIEEVRQYRGYVFRLEDVSVPEIVFASRPRDGGAISLARSTPVAFTVTPELDPENPGPPEGPGEAPPGPPPVWTWLGVMLAIIAGFEVLAWRRRRGTARAWADRRAAPARELQRLRSEPTDTPEQRRAVLAAAMDAVRDDIALRTGVPARARTSEEITALLAGAPAWDALATVADRSKFAGGHVDGATLADVLDRAIAFVESDPGGPAPKNDGMVGQA